MFQDGTGFASLLFECTYPENNIIPMNTSLSKQNSAFTMKTVFYLPILPILPCNTARRKQKRKTYFKYLSPA